MENDYMDKENLLQEFANILDLYGDDITRREYDEIPDKPVHSRTLEKRCEGWDSAKREARVRFPKTELPEEDNGTPVIIDSLTTRAIRLLKQQPYPFETLCDALEIPPKRGRQILNQIKEVHGHYLTQIGEAWTIADPLLQGPEDLVHAISELKHGRFGVVSDTHFGSKFQQLTYLNDFYERCYNMGVDFMLNIGDLTDGDGTVYRGQRWEMFLHGFTDIRDYTAEYYPKIEDVNTWVIAGNHDESFIKSANANILQDVQLKRPDMKYMGRIGAYLNLAPKSVKAYMHHPSGGMAYALSYKAQKFIEGFSSEHKPQVFFIGHYHSMGQFFIRNVHTFLCGCFQSQTPYLKAKGLMPQIGGWIIDFEVAEDGWSLEAVNSTIVPYYKTIREDYKNYPR
jgi:hypothetical protein